jgi:hypothetical protein
MSYFFHYLHESSGINFAQSLAGAMQPCQMVRDRIGGELGWEENFGQWGIGRHLSPFNARSYAIIPGAAFGPIQVMADWSYKLILEL